MHGQQNGWSIKSFSTILFPWGQEVKTPLRLFLKGLIFPLVVATGWLFLPDSAWALQSHGAPEGLYVHQMAHLHFVIALGYLLWDLRRSDFSGRGWIYLQVFCILMVFWNITAFVGHAAAGHIHHSALIEADSYLHARIAGPLDSTRIIYYLTKFDHFLAVPALCFLYLGMRALYRSVDRHAGEAGK